MPIPYKYLKSFSSNENISNELRKKVLNSFLIFDEQKNNGTMNNSTSPKYGNKNDNRTKPDNRTRPQNKTDNRTEPKPNNRTDNRTKPDNRTRPDKWTDSKTKPDNRTDNRTKPDNRTDPKPDNKTQDIELVVINTKAIEFTFMQYITLIFNNKKVNRELFTSIIVTKSKALIIIEIPLFCYEKEDNYTVSCVGDFTSVQNGIYIVYS